MSATVPTTGSMVLAVGQVARALPEVDLVLDLGAHHPTSHGLLTLSVTIEDERISSADVGVGHLHRGAEKLFEVRDYRQVMVLANRHDWLSAFSGELGVALAVEEQLGIDVPARATWIRMALAELGRLVHHLSFLTPLAYPDRSQAARSPASVAREDVLAAVEEATGGRLHVMAARIGGVRRDVPEGWVERLAAASSAVRAAVTDLHDRTLDQAAFVDRFAGRGVISAEQALAFGLSGVVARASGIDVDLRRDQPYLAYGSLAQALRVPVRTEGDALARIALLLDQTLGTADLLDALCEHQAARTPGPVDVRLPKVLRVPEGTTSVAVEAPGGISGYVLVSRGDKVPWRLKLRTPSFSTAAVLPELLVGASVDDVVPILQSLLLVVGDLDK